MKFPTKWFRRAPGPFGPAPVVFTQFEALPAPLCSRCGEPLAGAPGAAPQVSRHELRPPRRCYVRGCDAVAEWKDLVQLDVALTTPSKATPEGVNLGLYTCDGHALRIRIAMRGGSLKVSIPETYRRRVGPKPTRPEES